MRLLVEYYPAGYPRYSALIASYDRFFLVRRFRKIRARILLLKQDKLAILEERLDKIDIEENALLFLGKSRCDRNPERKHVLEELENKLADYGLLENQLMVNIED